MCSHKIEPLTCPLHPLARMDMIVETGCDDESCPIGLWGCSERECDRTVHVMTRRGSLIIKEV